MPTARVNGIDLYFERSGTGPPLLFVNGSGATLATATPMLALLSAHFDVVAHDQRGLGATGVPPGPYTMADYAEDAAGLARHVGWDRYRVLGVSFGGMVALELAVTYPQRLERLAVLCTSSGGEGGSSYPLHTLADLDPDEAASRRLRLVDTRFSPEWLDEHPGDRALVGSLARESAATRATRSAAARRCSSTPGATTTSPPASGGSPVRRSSRPDGSTASPRRRAGRRSPSACPALSTAATRAGIPSSPRTAPPSPRCSRSSAAEGRPASSGAQARSSRRPWRRWVTALVWIWQARLSVTPRISPISARFSPS